MDPIIFAIADLARANISITRLPDPFIEAYHATGFPELTRGQVFDLARRHGIRESQQCQ